MEAINDIVAEMRCGMIPKHRYDRELLINFADRIEQAVTNCNQLKMREALSDACYAMFNFLKTQNGGYEEMAKALDKAKTVLSAPLRNCDRKYKNGYDVLGVFTAETGRQIFETVDVINWLFAEAKGEKK
jgi:hypothetical protein